MSFQIISDVPHTLWGPVCGSSIPFTEATPRLHVGQLVKSTLGGFQRIDNALGIGDSTHRLRTVVDDINAASSLSFNNVYGVVIGTNRKTPIFSTTYNAEYIDYVAPYSAGTEDFVLGGGPWARGENRAMVKVALIDSTTILRGNIYSNTSGAPTAISELAITASSSGRSVTTATAGYTPALAGFNTVYFRSGGEVGTYRITNDTSATVHTWREHLANSTGANANVGNNVVKVSLRAMGKSKMLTGVLGLWVDGGSSFTSNYFYIDVIRLDLSVAGSEYVDFRFDPLHLGINVQATS